MKIYKKHHSFETFYSNLPDSIVIEQTKRAIEIIKNCDDEILQKARKFLLNDDKKFFITRFIAEEMYKIEDEQIPRYIYNRFRYDVYPTDKLIDEYPPYIQIEPSSMCNYKCTFCYQKNPYFNDRKNMGTMDYGLFRKIIDEIEGKVEFISIASRGEPFVSREIDKMLHYCKDKFLGLKVNTNGSLLDEKHIHAILSGGVNTIVFSVDTDNPILYGKYRKKGIFERVLSNIELFYEIRKTEYPESKIISRISGVKFENSQNITNMIKKWGSLVDQITYVKYNPWENVYSNPIISLNEPCTDLWRRLFIWHNGDTNPCDTDFKSQLSLGNIKNSTVSGIWNSPDMNMLRNLHLNKKRVEVEPCKRCHVT